MLFVRRTSCAALCASLLLATSSLLSGCNAALTSTPVTSSAISVSGNWQISSSAAQAARLPALSGTINGTGTSLHGILHSDSVAACVAPTQSFSVTGSADANNLVTLTGPVAGGTLTLTGTLASDGKSLSNASYTVAGGTCAFTHAAAASAVVYAPVTGTYSGNLTDGSGESMPITVNITQSTASDANGNFSATGSATFPQNPCIASPSSVTTAQITGGSFNFTYTDSSTQNQVVTQGSFSPDATKLTVSAYALSGNCQDTGSGVLNKQ